MDKPDRSPPAEPTHISPADCPNYYDHCRCAPTPEAPQADDVVRDLRNAAARLRRTPMPLSDVIPLLQRAADRIESDAARIRELEAKNARLTIDSGYYADNADAAMKWYENAERELAASREREAKLRKLAEAVTQWDWSDNDYECVRDVDNLRRYLERATPDSAAEQGEAK